MLRDGLADDIALQSIGVHDVLGDGLVDQVLQGARLDHLEHLLGLLLAGPDVPRKLNKDTGTRKSVLEIAE